MTSHMCSYHLPIIYPHLFTINMTMHVTSIIPSVATGVHSHSSYCNICKCGGYLISVLTDFTLIANLTYLAISHSLHISIRQCGSILIGSTKISNFYT